MEEIATEKYLVKYYFKLVYSYSNVLVPTCKFVSLLWGIIFELDICIFE